MIITPKNWGSFQHYKDRSPAWIKLHRGLLDDFAFSRLPVASRALAPILWLLASEYEGGAISAPIEELAFRFRMTEADLRDALTPLIDSGFFIASEPLAERSRPACLEKEDIDKKYRKEIEEISADEPPRAKAERKPRKGNSTPLPDNYALPEATKAFGLSWGFSSGEIAREHEKFRNHAKQNDRRCVDWIAAERNWLIGAAERTGKSAPVEGGAVSDGLVEVLGQEELDAWDEYGRKKTGKSFPRNSRGGWRFPSRWPPGYQPPERSHETPPIRINSMQ